MAQLSFQASNAIIYLTYGAMLFSGIAVAWYQLTRTSKGKNFLSSNGTSTGIPLALNFIASAMGCGILTSYTEIANIAGIQGLLVYVLAGGVPIAMFGLFGPIIRRRCPDGFVLTEWCRQRFGPIMGYGLSAATVLTIFLFMVGELTAINGAIETMTGISAIPCVVVECVVTTIYTSMGGFAVSFTTDTLQACFVLLVLIISCIGYGTQVHIDPALKHETYHQLMGSTRIGWMNFYILNVAILTNDALMSGFWLRTFAARTSKDLYIATGIASVVTTIICCLVGIPGILTVWTGDCTIGDPNGAYSFYILIAKMDKWIIGIVLIFCVVISTCTFDSLQSAVTSTISNDVFRNKFPIIYSRALVIVLMIPALMVAIFCSANVLQIYYIADLLSCSIIPIMFLGLSKHFYFLRGLDVIVGCLGSLLAVFIFGTIYYGSAKQGGLLLLIWNGTYDPNDWGAFGAFVITTFGCVVFGHLCAAVRIGISYLYCKYTGSEFRALDKPNNIAFGIGLDNKDDTVVTEFHEVPETESDEVSSIHKSVDVETTYDVHHLISSPRAATRAHIQLVHDVISEIEWKELLHLLV
ncbi:unnamed protein product [Pichia kudriavzevii]